MARGDVPSFLVGDPAAARDLNHLEARLRMPTDATVAKNRVASCDPSTAEVLPCSASRAADSTSPSRPRSRHLAAGPCSGMMSEHFEVLAAPARALLRLSLDVFVCAGRLSCGRANWSTVRRAVNGLAIGGGGRPYFLSRCALARAARVQGRTVACTFASACRVHGVGLACPLLTIARLPRCRRS